MILRQNEALQYYLFESLADQVPHGAFTRHGGFSQGAFASLNVGHTVGNDLEHVAANHEAIYRALGTCAGSVVTAHQVHRDHVAVVSPDDGGRVYAETDALISNVPGLFLMLRFADCVPICFYAPRQGAVGLAHAGWRGTLAKIAAKTAQAMMATFRCRPEEIYAGIGPSIGPCCFQVGPEVVEAFRKETDGASALFSHVQQDGRAHLDLWRANSLQLREVGLTSIEVAGLCTFCHRDTFYSHRAEQGHTGRFATVIGLQDPNACCNDKGL